MRPTALVVEDSITLRTHLCETLEGAGFAVRGCPTLRSARDALGHLVPDLVLLDVGLPDGDGLALLRDIRADHQFAKVPVMLLSGATEVRDRVRGIRSGADDYVGKPYDPAYVASRARMLVRQRRPGGREERVAAPLLLLIDDSQSYAASLAGELAHAGYDVRVAATGEEGLHLAFDLRPDAVVIDGNLPGIDGAGVVRRIRLDAGLRATPCLLLTDSAGALDEIRALEAGADAFAHKQSGAGAILARIAALLRKHGPRGIPEPPGSTIGPRRLLLVDGDPRRAEDTADGLRAMEWDVAVARSPDEAMELMGLQPTDCIVLEGTPPGGALEEFCRGLHGQPALRSVPVVLRSDADPIEAFGAGVDDCVSPSSGLAVLRARVRALLRRRQIEAEARAAREQGLRTEIEATKNAELALANEALRRAQRQNEEYAHFLVHDLKNPLAGIALHAEFLARAQGLPAEVMDSARKILSGTRRLDRMVMNLLDLAGQDDGRLRLETTSIPAAELLGEIAAEHERRAAQRQQTIVVESTEVALCADRDLLARAIANLVENACKYASPSSKIGISAAKVGDGVELRVIDHGEGVRADLRDRVFEKYVKLEGGDNFAGRQSRGLGLAFCRLVAAAHGGSIAIEDTPGGGATFVLRLPQWP